MTVNPKKLKELRKLAGIGQRDLAQALTRELKIKPAMPVATYSSKEINGRFSQKEINVLCKVLKIKPTDIMTEAVNGSDMSEILEELRSIKNFQLAILTELSRMRK